MAISYGFFDSKNHDRIYSSEDFGKLFDGIITDGVFSNIGNTFNVTTSGDSMVCLVDSGKAWFQHIWVYNDALYYLTLDPGHQLNNRIDAIVIEIDKRDSGRYGDIKVVKGEAAPYPTKPTLIKEDGLYQYAIAYISVAALATSISETDIEMAVGSEETPFITGLVDQVAVEDLYKQWNSNFESYFRDWSRDKYAEFEIWKQSIVNELNQTQIGQIQTAIESKEDIPIGYDVEKDLLTGGTTVTFNDPSINFYNNDYIVDVYSSPPGARLLNIETQTSYMYLTFEQATQDYVIKILVRAV